jgi:hypothetical protein
MFYQDGARSHLSLFVILLLCALFQSLRAASAKHALLSDEEDRPAL